MINRTGVPMRALLFAGFSLGAISAHAIVTMDFDTLYTGTLPGGPAPWATLTIQDSAINEVTMTLTHNPSSASDQFLSRLFLNVVDFPSDLSFAASSSLIAGHTFSEDGVNLVGGPYDIGVLFNLAPPADRLLPGLSATWTISGTGIDENSFSTNSPGGVLAMLHIQGIGPNGEDSGHVTVVPEPATIFAIGIGLAAIAARRRKS